MTDTPEQRNLRMAQRISATPVHYPFSFVVAGDSGAWPDPTADAILTALLQQTARLQPAPVFFANLGDFAGPGTIERHRHYLRLVEPLGLPNVCVVGNHDLDDPSAPDAWARTHGPMNFQFGYGHTRFVAIDAAPGVVGESVVATPEGTEGPRDEALAFLAHSLEAAFEPHRVVLMHCPPHFNGRFAPHSEWGFDIREREFLSLIRTHGVKLVCCAHALLFDYLMHHGTHFVVSGGGGTALCSHFRGVCAEGEGRPEDRGALFHAVQITVTSDGAIRPGAAGLRADHRTRTLHIRRSTRLLSSPTYRQRTGQRRASQLTVPELQRPLPGTWTTALSRPLASLLANEKGSGKAGLPCGSKPILPRTPTPRWFRLKNLPWRPTATFRKRTTLDTLPDSQAARQRKRTPSLVCEMTRMTKRPPWEVLPRKGP